MGTNGTKKVTTSAQKTVSMAKSAALRRLEDAVGRQEDIAFEAIGNPDIRVAHLADGTTLCVAGFHKDEGRAIAMIDHKGVPEPTRQRWQRHWRESIDKAFD